MKFKSILLLILLFSVTLGSVSAQEDCYADRYTTELFPNFDTQKNIQYGAAMNNGQMQNLQLDIYTPRGDDRNSRPLIILAHGGSFIGGDRTQAEVTQFCEAFAKRGFVTATISYRLSSPLDLIVPANALKAAIKGTFDGKAAVRFFRKSFENGNPYGIDTSRIYIGGSSAGAFIATHLAYLNSMEEYAEVGDTNAVVAEGGINGNSGNPGYSSQVAGVINLCGALGKATWLNANEPPLISLHGTADGTVPYKHGDAAGVFPVDGSYLIDSVSKALGHESHLYTFIGADHVPYAQGASAALYRDTTIQYIQDNIYNWICKTPNAVAPDQAYFNLKVSPNPANDNFVVSFAKPVTETVKFELIDAMGRVVWSRSTNNVSEMNISISHLPVGIYHLKTVYGSNNLVKTIVKQ